VPNGLRLLARSGFDNSSACVWLSEVSDTRRAIRASRHTPRRFVPGCAPIASGNAPQPAATGCGLPAANGPGQGVCDQGCATLPAREVGRQPAVGRSDPTSGWREGPGRPDGLGTTASVAADALGDGTDHPSHPPRCHPAAEHWRKQRPWP
jgi:hypothetical protein